MRQIISLVFFVFLINNINAQTFTNSTGGAIPDNGTAFTFFPITVSGVGVINTTTGLKSVCINITHDFTDELQVFLIAPDNNFIPLTIEKGDDANYTNTCFDMSATVAIGYTANPFTGNFLPETPLGWFNNGMNANGVWRLAVIDGVMDDAGTLNNWSITFGSTPAPQPVPNCAGNPPANNFCSNAPLICNANTYCGKTDTSYSGNSWTSLSNASLACNNDGVLLNSFLKFVASATTATFNVAVSSSFNNIGITMLAYEGNCGATVTPKGCANLIPIGPTNTFTATGLTVGNTYFLTMDIGFNAIGTGDFCDYAIRALTGVQMTVPTFAPIAPICSGATAPVLPLTSINSITGTWSPATVSNTASGTYTFTPALGQCGGVTTLNVTVNANSAPTFAAILAICNGATAPVLPTTSTNGVIGTWMPAVVSNTASGMYTFTPNAGQCTNLTAVLNVTVNPNITPTFNPIPAFCAGIVAPTLPAMSTNGITGTWSPAIIDNMAAATYTFTPNAGQCGTSTTLTTTINSSVTTNFAAIAPFCSGTVAPLLPATSLNGITGTWSPATISNTASGTYTFTPNMGQCGTMATLNITVNPNITPTFAPIAPICSGSAAPLLPATSTNGITGTWSPALISNTTSGTYTFTPNSGQGCVTTATLNVNVTTMPALPTFNPISPICNGSVAPLLPTTSTNGFVGTWLPATISNTASGMYTFTPNAGQCATNATINVVVTNSITPTFASIAPICNGSTAPLLQATSTNGISGTWFPTVISNTISGTYTFTPSAGQCGTTATLNVTVNPLITPTFNPIAPICNGGTAPTLPLTSTNGIMGTWSPSAISNTTSGTYNFTPNAGQCANNGAINVTVNPFITPTFIQIPPICTGTTAPILPTTSTNGFTGSWSPAIISNTASGSYTFTPNAGQGCLLIATMSITVSSASVTPNFAPIAPICDGSVAPILPTTSTDGFVGSWSPAIISNTTSASYTFTPTPGQCANATTVNIIVVPNATPTFDAIPSICTGTTAPALPSISTNGIPGTWSPAIISNTTSATYTFTPTAGLCATTATLMVTVDPIITPTFAALAPFCNGGAAPLLQATSTNGIPGTWLPVTINNIASATYTFTPAAGQCASTATLNATVIPLPYTNLGLDSVMCEGDSVLLDVTNADPTATYIWQNASTASTFMVKNPGTYTVKVSLNGCDNTDSKVVTYTLLPRFTLGADKGLCIGDSLTLSTIVTSSNPVTYLWQDGSILPTFKLGALGAYSLDVTNNCGTTTDNILIVPGVCDLILPKAFTPNNDGRNDILRVRGDLPAKSFSYSIFNRYGQRIFFTTDKFKGWDGKVNGVAQATGTYVYHIDYINALNNVRRTYNGAVTLIR